MAYADLNDVNTKLPVDKLQMTEAELELYSVDVDRMIRGYVATFFAPTVIASWTDPGHTPELLRSVAGSLIASAYYAQRFSEESTDDNWFAQNLYNKAINTLLNIQEGKIIVVTPDGTELEASASSLTTDDFWPNDATGRLFSMSDQF